MTFMTLSRSEVDLDPADHEIALEYLASIWGVAENEGVAPETIAEAAIFAALATLVEKYGEETAAEEIALLPRRIRVGEFTLRRNLQ